MLFLKSLPILVVLNLFSFLIVGVYRGIWRYTSVGFGHFRKRRRTRLDSEHPGDFAFVPVSRFFAGGFHVVNTVLLFLALAGSRMAFRLFRQLLPVKRQSEGYRKVLIYGAGDGGELVLRELYNNPEWNYAPVGFCGRRSDENG
jgi:UDP-GlcNAc:undecaprenyl-phosphate GlcNAc-1-phosphate transferase